MTLPAWTSARIALKGIWLAFIGALFAALALALAIQTARLEGFHIWPVSMTGWIKTAEDRQATIDDFTREQALAKARAAAARQSQEQTYREIAERIDEHAQDDLGRALDAADRFIAAGGLRSAAAGSAGCRAGTAGAYHPAEDSGRAGRATQLDADIAGVLDRIEAAQAGGAATGEGFVTVTAADVRICTRNTVKAEAGHALATQLQAASTKAD